MKKFIVLVFAVTVFLLMGRPVLVQAAGSDKVTGEVIDTYCYVTMGARGESHSQCGIRCAKKGIPVAILENGTGKIYVLLPNKDETSLPDDVINKMGKTATVTGKILSNGGSQFLTVESVS